jgi:SAM-dependent methyltransferase
MQIFHDYDVLIDSITDWKKRVYSEGPLFDLLIRKRPSTWLDLSSGSGERIAAFGHTFSSVIGLEKNPFLLEKAKSKEILGDVQFFDCSLENLSKYVPRPTEFDLITLFQNKLSMVINDDNLHAWLVSIKEHLARQGMFVTVLLNYNALLKHQDFEFGKISFTYDDKHFNLLRYLSIIDTDVVKYSAEVYAQNGDSELSFQQLLKPLTKGRIERLYQDVGLEVVEMYGDSSLHDFDPDTSKYLIVISR